MLTTRICSLADVAALVPADCWVGQRLREEPGALDDKRVLHITGDLALQELHLNDASDGKYPLRPQVDGLHGAPYLILVQGSLQIDGALTSDDQGSVAHLIVLGTARVRNAILTGSTMYVRDGLTVDELLWGDYSHGELQLRGGLQARVALFTDEFQVHIEGPEQVEFLLDEVRGVPHRAEFSSEIVGAVFPPEFHDGIDAGEDGLAQMLDRGRVLAAVRAGKDVARTSEAIHAWLPVAHEFCSDGAISVENILSVVRSPVVAHREHRASGWFQQTDFAICQRHVDEEGDQRDDSVFITVWKTWDFYLSVQPARVPQGLLPRLAGALRRRPAPSVPELTLLYRAYANGEPGEWKPLSQATAPDAWGACAAAWRGVLDYVRKAVAQHRARYPLYQRLVAELTAREIEELTLLPVFTERYNDWWDSDRNGHWQGDVWVGARQPCMHDGQPWGRALKLSWENGEGAPGDEEDDAHASYQINLDEAREGAALVEFTYAQRQSEARVPLPRGAADHVARLLRFYGLVQSRLRDEHAREQARQAEARRIEAAVRLLATPPMAPNMPDSAVFPVELMELSAQWQDDGAAYVAAIRAHQLDMEARQAPDAVSGNSHSDSDSNSNSNSNSATDDAKDIDPAHALPSDPRKAAAPTVLQLARVVNAQADADLGERFRQRFAFAPDAYVHHAANAGCFIGPVIALDDGRVLARIGPEYEDSAHWVALQGRCHTPLPALRGLGRSHDRRIFAQSDGRHVTTHQGFDGPLLARFGLPRGNEGLPPHLPAGTGPLAQRCDQLIPFSDGRRVLLRNPTGIYLLTALDADRDDRAGAVQRLHPQAFDEDGPYTWPKNQMDAEVDGETVTLLAMDMLHMALSPDERYLAVGDQDSHHILLDAQGAPLAEHEPLSSYPHHAAFSHDGARLFANSCHLYGGCTLSLPMPPQHAPDTPSVLDGHRRVYASATQPGLVVLGDADGYLHARSDDGQELWRHHVGSTVSAMDISADGGTIWAATYGGYLARLERSEAGMDPYSIGTSPYVETGRWIFWSDEATPLLW